MALTADRNTPSRDTKLLNLLVAAGVVIRAGALVAFNADGFLTPGAVADDLIYAGRADETVDNTNGDDGDVSCNVSRGRAFKFLNSGDDPVEQEDMGKTCYIVDDETVAKTSDTGDRSAAGKVVGIDSDGVWIE